MDDHTVSGRTVAILDLVALSGVASLAALTEHTGIPRSTAYRLAEDLCRRGVLLKKDNLYRLGSRIVAWGCQAAASNELRQAADPYVWDMYERTGEFAWLYLVEGEDVHMLARSHGSLPGQMASIPWPKGQHRTALLLAAGGRAAVAGRPDLVEDLLAGGVPRTTPYAPRRHDQIREGMARCRESGFAVEQECFAQGWGCVAAPISDPSGQTCGVIGLTVRAGRLTPQRFSGRILGAAEAIAGRLRASA